MNIREYRKSDFDSLHSVMCDAFSSDSLYSYFIEDEEERKKFVQQFMKFRLKFGIKKGKVFVTDDCNCLLILIMPNQEMKPGDLLTLGGMAAMMHCSKEQRNRIVSFNALADKQKEKMISQPYWHISPICVETSVQGNGYGSALMNYAVKYMNNEYPCYLETQSSRNIHFYGKFGFQETEKICVPDSELISYSMILNKKK